MSHHPYRPLLHTMLFLAKSLCLLPGDGIANFTADSAETVEEDEEIGYEQGQTEMHHLSGKAIWIIYEYS